MNASVASRRLLTGGGPRSLLRAPRGFDHGFTLIELLIVIGILTILMAIALPNFINARERAQIAADRSNLHVIGVALQTYFVDYGDLPPADTEAGPYESSGTDFKTTKNGPAAGGSLDGLPWVLYDKHYVADWHFLFCPIYLKDYSEEKTIRGDYPRYHNFRYAYNAAGLSRGGLRTSGIMSGVQWLVRDLSLDPQSGFYAESYPDYPGDYRFPWGDGKNELALYADGSVHMVTGGTDALLD